MDTSRVLSQFEGLKKVGEQVANWDRTQGHDKMQSLLQAHPDIIGVISGNDEMALGAIAALKEAGKLASVKVGGFDGSPDAVAAIKAGELQYTVLQPVAVYCAEGGGRSRLVHQDRQDRRREREAAVRLHAHHQGQYRGLHRSVHAQIMKAGGERPSGRSPTCLKCCAAKPEPHVS